MDAEQIIDALKRFLAEMKRRDLLPVTRLTRCTQCLGEGGECWKCDGKGVIKEQIYYNDWET